MHYIRNTKLFNELQECPEWDTLFDTKTYDTPVLKDDGIPVLEHGICRISVKPDAVEFIANGVQGKPCADFAIIREEV